MDIEDSVRIRHMIDAAESALRFVKGRSRADLDSDEMLHFALIRAIEIIGEAASKISVEARSTSPGVPWPEIIGMRNRLIHAYFDVNLDILWRTVQEAIPVLLNQLKTIHLSK
jgi:uncharacterized protein with HEPN domain